MKAQTKLDARLRILNKQIDLLWRKVHAHERKEGTLRCRMQPLYRERDILMNPKKQQAA